jgi:hypothetical protein
MKAFVTTVQIVLDPRVVGPDAPTEWTTSADVADWMSALLSENKNVLDCRSRTGPRPSRCISSEEGEFIALMGGTP